MKNTGIRNTLMYILAFSAVLFSCDKVKMAKNSETEILTFKFEEYPDAKVDIVDNTITVHLPEDVSDLNLTPIFTISEGAICNPKSGEKKDFGFPVGISVVSEDNLYITTYHVSVVYPANKMDFNSVQLAPQSQQYGADFSLSFAGFTSSATTAGLIKWNGFALSNRSGADLNNPQPDIASLQFFPGKDSGLGNMLLVRTGYGQANAADVNFSRPVNLDTITVVPSALTLYCMKNEYVNDAGQLVTAMNTVDGDYMTLVLEGYDAQDNLAGTKELPIADFSSERPFIREDWQLLKMRPTRLKDIVKLKIYVKGKREEFYPIFAIDKFTYQVQPQLTPSEDED